MNKLPTIHPGEILEDQLEELQLSPEKLAAKLHVSSDLIVAILNGREGITADTALRLSAFFGTSAEFWLRLQNGYDLKIAEKKAGKKIKAQIRRLHHKAKAA